MFNRSSEGFFTDWESYLVNVENVINVKIKFLMQKELGEDSGKRLEGLARGVIDQLKSDKCQSAMKEVVKDCYPETVELVNKELQFFNALVKEIQADGNDFIKINFALNSASTIKGSVEEIFKLPRWLKNIFHILNEVLGILGFSSAQLHRNYTQK
jgi:hypothetical protein